MPLHVANPRRGSGERWVWLYTGIGLPGGFAARYTLDELSAEHRDCTAYFLSLGYPLDVICVESESGDGALTAAEYLHELAAAILLAQAAQEAPAPAITGLMPP